MAPPIRWAYSVSITEVVAVGIIGTSLVTWAFIAGHIFIEVVVFVFFHCWGPCLTYTPARAWTNPVSITELVSSFIDGGIGVGGTSVISKCLIVKVIFVFLDINWVYWFLTITKSRAKPSSITIVVLIDKISVGGATGAFASSLCFVIMIVGVFRLRSGYSLAVARVRTSSLAITLVVIVAPVLS